jgi:hypothetical protein
MADRLNLPELQRLTNDLATARSQLALAQRLLDALEMKNVHVSVNATVTVRNEEAPRREDASQGYAVPLTEVLPYSNGQVRTVAANKAVLQAMQRHARERLIAWASKVEGIEFQIRRLTRG